MANVRNELKSRQITLSRLHNDLKDSFVAKRDWNTEVRARRTLGSDETIEHLFLAEHFLMTWSNWQCLFERFCCYFGQPAESFPKTWSQLIANCEVLVFMLARDRNLDELIAKSWIDPGLVLDRLAKGRGYNIASIYTQIATSHERAALLSRAERVQPKFARTKKAGIEQSVPKNVVRDRIAFEVARSVVLEQNERLIDHWQELPRRIQEQVWLHLRHYLHSTLGVSWLADATPGVSGLLSISWRKQAVSISLQDPAGLSGLVDPISRSVAGLLDRLKTAISELGYEAVVEDLLSPELIGGQDSLLASDDVMVIPGHLADEPRLCLLAVTRGWAGKQPLSFAKVMRQVKARLIEARGAIQVVIVFCDCWDSASFQEEHREELNAHNQNGVRFLFVMVGVPDRVLVPIPVEFDRVQA
jgi:hypothetical protein